MALRAGFWNRMYRGVPSWELGRADPALVAALEERNVRGPGRALDVGCGTGDNAIELARRGFSVTAIDIADRPLALAREKAAAAGVSVDLRLLDVTRLDEVSGAFDLIVDRGLLMSLFGERARNTYATSLIRLCADDGHLYQHQWALPGHPRVFSPGWLAVRTRGLVVAPDEIDARFGGTFEIEELERTVEPTDDPGLRRMGIREVARTSWWLRRRPSVTVG